MFLQIKDIYLKNILRIAKFIDFFLYNPGSKWTFIHLLSLSRNYDKLDHAELNFRITNQYPLNFR